RDPKLAEQCLHRINEAQKKSNELKDLQSADYRGLACFHRVKAQGPDEYYCLQGHILAFTSQKPMLHRALDLSLDQAPVDRQQPFLSQELDRLGLAKSMATFWLNPRSFDPELAQKLKQAKDSEAFFLSAFQQIWQALDGIGCGLNLEQNLEC